MRTATALLDPGSVLNLTLRKQHLARGSAANNVRQVVDDLLGLHATDRRSPYLQLHARMTAFSPPQLDSLLDRGQAARIGFMRQTLFIESAGLIPLMLAATRRLSARRHARYLEAFGIDQRLYKAMARRITAALHGRALDAREIQVATGAVASISPMLIVMCDRAELVRWKARGGWRAGGQTYRLFAEALPGIDPNAWDEEAALAKLVHLYIKRYGPVTSSDVAWWTGYGQREVADALGAATSVARARIRGSEEVLLVDEADLADARRLEAPDGEVSLLPVLDPFLQGRRDREGFLENRHRDFVVDRGGNVTSVIVLNGRVEGVWDLIERPAPEVRVLFFDPPEAGERRRVREVAEQIGKFATGGALPVVEVDRMIPLTRRGAGGVVSPLRTAGR